MIKNRVVATVAALLSLAIALPIFGITPPNRSTDPDLKYFLPIPFPKNISTNDLKQHYLENILDSALNANNMFIAAKAYRALGDSKRDQSLYHLAIEYYQKGLNLSPAFENAAIDALILNDIGTCYRRLDNNKEALVYHKRSLNQAKKTNNRLAEAYTLNGIGNIFLAAKDPITALLYFKKSLQLSKLLNIPLGEAINYGNIGNVYAQMQQYNLALKYYFKSLDKNRTIKSGAGIKICYTNISEAYQRLNQLEKALKFAKLALNNLGETEEFDRIAFQIRIAHLYKEKSMLQKSNIYALKAAKLSEETHSKSQAYEAYSILKSNYLTLNSKDEYLKYYEKSLLYLDSLNTEAAIREIRDLKKVAEINDRNNRINQLINKNKIYELERKQNKHNYLVSTLGVATLVLFILLLSISMLSKISSKSTSFESQLKRSQLNPHFIYNSLNSIQKYIWSNNPDQASVYLSDFSLLMRKSMESMRQNSTVLSKEIELLTLYLKLEQQRLIGGFDFTFKVHPSVDPDEISIPPLITQPFIENAIWHGIAPILHLRRGEISIQYSRKKNSLVVEIVDNGEGITKAKFERLIGKKGKEHNSAGIKITSERLKLSYYNIKAKRNYDIKIENLSESNPSSFGTKSTIQIPFKEVY